MGLAEHSILILAAFLGLLIVQASGQNTDNNRRTGNTCNADPECPDNAWCKFTAATAAKGFCVCKDSYIIRPFNETHRECLREAEKVGDPCAVDVQCQSKLLLPAACVEGECRCKEGAHVDSGRCYDTVVVGERCTVSQNCYIGVEDGRPETQAFCVRGICSCTLLHSPRDGGTRCIKDASLGESCEDDEQCVAGGLRCGDGVCRCLDSHAPHPLEPRCLPVTLTLAGPCEVDTQCRTLGTAAVCESGLCSCAWGSKEASGKCWTIKTPGEDCLDSRECVLEDGGNGTCIHGACSTIFISTQEQTGSGVERSGLNIFRMIATAVALTLLSQSIL